MCVAIKKEEKFSWNGIGCWLGLVGQDPSGSKSNLLHVDIFQFCFIHLIYIL